MSIKAKIGADNDGYPWILGYQGESLSSLTGAQIVNVNPFIELHWTRTAPRADPGMTVENFTTATFPPGQV